MNERRWLAVPCMWCGKLYSEHLDVLREGQLGGPIVPRMPCVGLKSGYVPQSQGEPPPALVDRLLKASQQHSGMAIGTLFVEAAAEIERLQAFEGAVNRFLEDDRDLDNLLRRAIAGLENER